MINQNRQKYIISFVDIIKDIFNISSPLTKKHLACIIDELGGSLEYTSDTIYNVNIKRNNNSFTVYINNNLISKNTELFSIANELGHLFLHMKILDHEYWKKNIIEDTAYFRYGRGMEQAEAHIFAFELLNN